MSGILNSAILNSGHLGFCHLSIFFSNSLTLANIGSHHLHKKTSLIHSDSTWWWQPTWFVPCWMQTLPSWIQIPCYLLSDCLKNTPTLLWLLTQTNSIRLKLIHSHFNCDDGRNLEFCHLEFVNLGYSHLSIFFQSHSHLQRLVPTICTKKTSLIHSDSSWWWQPSWIVPCWIQTLPSWIQIPCYLLSDSLKNTLTLLWLLTQTNSIWLKLIHSHLTWWWQESWILPSWILAILDTAILVFSSQTHSHLPRLVPTTCTKKTSLIHSASSWWW